MRLTVKPTRFRDEQVLVKANIGHGRLALPADRQSMGWADGAVIEVDGSDTAKFDNTLEFLMLAGRPLSHAAMMMIPEPWSKHETMSDEKKAFYEYHSCIMEPWDGPAAMVFSDGHRIAGPRRCRCCG